MSAGKSSGAGMTRKQELLLERILQGEALARVLDELKVNGRTWKRWLENDVFRANLGRGIEEKELVEVIDALTLNRRAYNKLLRACNGGSDENDKRPNLEKDLMGSEEKIDERSAKTYLSIIEAMAKRLNELSPKLRRPDDKESPDSLEDLTPEEYDALAKYLTELRAAH
jgi:hypothetical protein